MFKILFFSGGLKRPLKVTQSLAINNVKTN